MVSSDAEYRVSVLLRALGPEFATAMLEHVPEKRKKKLSRIIDEMDRSPPTSREALGVLQEFDRLLTFATKYTPGATGAAVSETIGFDSADLDLSEDPFEAIEQVPERRLIAALRDEEPRTIAVVLSCLEETKAARILQHLPDQQRDNSILQLKEQFSPTLTLLTELLRATIEKCLSFEDRELMAESVDSDARVAKLLRTMEPERRGEVLEMLESADPEAAERIRSSLFSFTDLGNVADRSMRKLLAEVDTNTLSLALKSASEQVTGRVLSNLSRRAKEALTEEISLLGDIGRAEQEAAELAVVQAMIELDKIGQLVMGEES